MASKGLWDCLFTLGFLFALPLSSQSQIFKLPPVLYQSGGRSARSLAVADVNKDGIPDVIVANGSTVGSGGVGVLFGIGGGTFKSAQTYPVLFEGADAVAVADLNGDGWPDLVVGSNGGVSDPTPSLSVLLNKGDGTFKAAIGYSAGFDIRSVAIADVNGDGKPDVIALDQADRHFIHSAVAVLLGNGDGTFDDAVTYELLGGTNALSLATADLNGDGKPDLVLTDADDKGNGIIEVLLNEGDGRFPTRVKYLSGVFGSSVTLGDVNGNGKPDAIVASAAGSVAILSGNGNGTFSKAVLYPTGLAGNLTSVAIGDLNGDGTPDLVISGPLEFRPQNGKVAVLINNGGGTFKAPIIYGTGGLNAYSVAIANLNRDLKPDLVVADECDGYITSCPAGGGVAVLLGVPARTTTTLMTSGSPSLHGQQVTFTATIIAAYGPIPNGIKVTFYNNGTRIGTAKTMNGAARFTTTALAVGTHTIRASFPSSPFFKASSATVSQVVN